MYTIGKAAKPRVLGLIILLFLLSSCRINYDEILALRKVEEEIPNVVMENIRYTEVSRGEVSRVISADRFYLFSATETILINGGSGRSFTDKGELEIEGRANLISYNEGSKNAAISGQIYTHYREEGIEIWTEEIKWEDKSRMLTTEPNIEVTVSKEGESVIVGKGLIIDGKRHSLEFTGETTGILQSNSPETAANGE